MTEAYIYDAIRTPRGRGKRDGSLHTVKPLDLVVGLIVNSMQEAHAEESNAATEDYRDEVIRRLAAIEARLDERR